VKPKSKSHTVGPDRAARPTYEVADVFRLYGEAYRATHGLPASHQKVMDAIATCRTEAMGGHLEHCDTCDYERPAYNSCSNRHCPKCQSLAKAKWLKAREAELLPVGYFHSVFTLPHELNPLALCNKRVIYHMHLRCVSQTLQDVGRRLLGGHIGFTAILHTWDQQLRPHFHVHCIIPGGALTHDREHWCASPEEFLFPVWDLSLEFRKRVGESLLRAFKRRELVFPDPIAQLADARAFKHYVESVQDKDWVVYVKPPFAGPASVLGYLARYTHRVAISNHRIRDVSHGNVTFTYRDRRDGNIVKHVTLSADAFIGRFLLHVLPSGFQRIRH
jgi:hypothetical protein